VLRRFATAFVAVLVLAVVSATPALAKDSKDPGGPKHGSGTGTTASGPGAGTGGTVTPPSANPSPVGQPGAGSGDTSGSGTASGSSSGVAGKKPTSATSTGKASAVREGTKNDPGYRPAPKPIATSTSAVSSDDSTSSSAAVSGASVVRASAAPARTDTGITTFLPAPNPMLLPDSATTVAAPVSAARTSSLPMALPALLIGVGVLSVALTGTVLARRRSARRPA
jgi:hypothetical protein